MIEVNNQNMHDYKKHVQQLCASKAFFFAINRSFLLLILQIKLKSPKHDRN